MITSLCIALNVLATIIPSMGYVFPALAGMVVLIVVFECGYSMSYKVYFVASVLSFLLCAEKLPAVAFISLLGFYPIVKLKIDNKLIKNKIIKNKIISLFLKAIIFNASIFANFWIEVKLFNVPQEAFYIFDIYVPNVLWAIANVIYLMYDKCVDNFIKFYIGFLRPRVKKIINV